MLHYKYREPSAFSLDRNRTSKRKEIRSGFVEKNATKPYGKYLKRSNRCFHNSYSLCSAFFLFLLFFLSVPATAFSAERYVLFILDTSDSMTDMKVEIAKNVILQSVKHRPSETEIALRVFNQDFLRYNRYTESREYQEANCGESDMLLDFNNYAIHDFGNTLFYLKTQGLSPIASTLGESRYDFYDKKKKNTIILLTDGSDTCGGSPCDTASQLRKKYGIEVNVVGIGIEKKSDEKELLCIAEASGGIYINTKDENDLFESVFSIMDLPRSPLVIILLNEDGEKVLGNIKIYDENENLVIKTPSPLREFSPTLPLGDYSIEVKTDYDHQKIRNVVLEKDKPTDITIVLKDILNSK